MRINLKILSVIIAVLILAAVAKSQPTGTDPNIRDTLFIQSVTTYSTSSGIVPVYFYNDQDLAGVSLTLTYNSLDVMIDSFSFVGGRLENSSFKDADPITSNSISIYSFAMANEIIASGSGLLGHLHLSFIPGITPQEVIIDTMTITISDREFSTAFSEADQNALAFSPHIISGVLSISSGSCCLGDRGNVDNSPDDLSDISDLVYFVDFMFTDGPGTICEAEANVDGSLDEVVDISDLVYMVDYMFTDGPDYPSCP